MRTREQQDIKYELSQKMVQYQQAKITEKAQEERHKLILKQQVMQDILRRKDNKEHTALAQQKLPNQLKVDSKLYSFGFSNPQSMANHQLKNLDPESDSQPEQSREEESSVAYVRTVGNKYVGQGSDKWNRYQHASFANEHEPQQGESQESEEGDMVRTVQASVSASNVHNQMSQNRSSAHKSAVPPESASIYKSKYDQSNGQSEEYRHEVQEGFSVDRSSNVLNMFAHQQLKAKDKYRADALAHSKFIDSALHLREEKEPQQDHQEQIEPDLESVNQAASYLSKQYINNNSDLKSKKSPKPQEKTVDNVSSKNQLPPKPDRRVQRSEDQQIYLTQAPETPQHAQKAAYEGFIKEGQAGEEYLQSLRKKKITQMERKRQQRSQDRKKSQDIHSRLEKSANIEGQKKETPRTLNNKQRKSDQYHPEQNSLPPPPPQRKPVVSHIKSRTSSQAENNRSSGFDKNSKRRESPYQGSSIQSSSSKGLLKTPKGSIFQNSPSRPRDKSLSKLFQDPKIQPKQRKQSFTKQSNKKMMMNAITNVCLQGQINKKEREKLLDVLQQDPSEYFIFLFKQYSRNVIKAIYTYETSSGSVCKIFGDKAPNELHAQNVLKFYRFDSGAKEFKTLDGCKSFSYAVHAVYIK